MKLTILTSSLQFAPIFLVFLLPDTKVTHTQTDIPLSCYCMLFMLQEDQKKMQEEGIASWWGGFGLIAVVVASFLFTVALNIYLLVVDD